ncbi:MAG: hypothetical protein AAF556_11195 [Pseudomonadota bacterium]
MSVASIERELGKLMGRLDAIDASISRVEGKVDAVDKRVQTVEQYQSTDKVVKRKGETRMAWMAGLGGSAITAVGSAAAHYFTKGGAP